MKINDAIAAAILAYCVAAAPASLNSTSEESAALPSAPILHITSSNGMLQPEPPSKVEMGHLVSGRPKDFPVIVKDHNRNLTEPHPPVWKPLGHGGHGPVVTHPKGRNSTRREMIGLRPATGGPLLRGITPVNVTRPVLLKDNNDTYTDEIKVTYRSTSNNSGACSAKANAKRSIAHEHDQEHNVIDVCNTNTKEENYKTGDTITSQSRVHVGNVHTDRVADSHKDSDDGVNKADGLEGLNDLPPQLREHYLDELAKLNSTKMNFDINEKHNNSTLTTETKSNPKDGSSSSQTDLHTINITTHRTHDKITVDTKGPVFIDHNDGKNETQQSSSYLPTSSSFAILETTSTNSLSIPTSSFTTIVETPALVEPTTTSQSSEAQSTSTSSTDSATTSKLPIASLVRALVSKFNADVFPTPSPSKAFVSSNFVEPMSESKATITSTSTSTTTLPAPTSTNSKPRPKSKAASPKPISTSTAAEVLNPKLKGPNNEDLEPVQPQRRGDQRAYLAGVQKLNAKHMNDVQACKANVTCIAVSNREFASSLAELDSSMA